VYGSVALVVVDTNVWLDELERLRAWAPLHRARLACPFAVVRELDGLKNSDSAQLAGKARAALRFILQEAAAPAGIVVVQAFHQVFHLLDASGAHAPANADEQILDYALWLLRARTAAAALLSHDVALCVKAAANGVPHGPKGVLEALERAGRVARAQLASQSQPVHPQPRAQPPLPLPPPRPQQPQHAAREPSLPPPVAVSSAPAPAVAAHADPPAAVAPAEPRADALPPAPARPPAPPELAGPPRAHEAGVGVDELARSLAARDKELLALREQHAALEQALATLSLTQAAAAKGGAQPAGSQAVGAGARAARLAARPELVDLLSATAEQFQTLPGVGPALARRIVEFREREPLLLRTAADLLRVKGLGPKVVEVIKQSGQLLGSA
jgi:DNA uptake protein ComE-like DNA-binding protein